MPCCERESTSLISLAFCAVRTSSSFTRSRTGESCRCTYFLRAKGFSLPQKPCFLSTTSGWWAEEPWVALGGLVPVWAFWSDCIAGWLLWLAGAWVCVEDGC